MGVASFKTSETAFVDLRVRVVGCLRGEGLATGSLVGTLERVERFATAGLVEGFLVGTLSDEGVGRLAEDCWSGISLIPERVVRDFVMFAGAFLVVAVAVAVVAAVVALGAEGGLRRRIGRGITVARVYW